METIIQKTEIQTRGVYMYRCLFNKYFGEIIVRQKSYWALWDFKSKTEKQKENRENPQGIFSLRQNKLERMS